MTNSRSRGSIATAWLFGIVLVILLATLPPQPGTTTAAFLRSLAPANLRWRDVAQNLALYAPLGVLLAARGASVWRVCGVSAALSLLTELVQYVIPGRDPAVRDVLTNTLGALAGCLAVTSNRFGPPLVNAIVAAQAWISGARNPGRRRASTLLSAWAAAVACVLAGTAALLQPAPLPVGGLAVASPFLDRSPAPLRIGSNGTDAGYFSGTIDEVRIYNSVRSPEQIVDDMNTVVTRARSAEAGLVAAYGFDSNGGKTARDDSGKGHDGTVSGATWVRDGRFGGALKFDGATSELVVPAARDLDSDSALTLEAWVRASRVLSPEATIMGRSDDAYYLRAASSFGPFRAAGGGRFGSTPRFAYAPDAFRPDEWTHLAMTFDTRAIRLYVNGVLSATRVHWSPHRPLGARLNGRELASGPVPDADAFRRILTGAVALDVTLVCGHLDRAFAPVFLIAGIQSSETLAVTASGGDLFVKPLGPGARISLPSPPTRVPGAMHACAPGDRFPLRITGPLHNPEVWRGAELLTAVPPGLGAAWSFVIHADLLPGWVDVMITAVWLAALALPLGLWARWSAAGVVGIGVIVAALAYLPIAFQVRGWYGREIAFLVIGGTLGVVVRATDRRAIPPNDFAHREAA